MEKDKMPKWMLHPMTNQELLVLYDNLPFVRAKMTFKQFKKEWENQMADLHK